MNDLVPFEASALERTLRIEALDVQEQVRIAQMWEATAPKEPEAARPRYQEPSIPPIGVPLFFMGILLSFIATMMLATETSMDIGFVLLIGLGLLIAPICGLIVGFLVFYWWSKRSYQKALRKTGWLNYRAQYQFWFTTTSSVIQLLVGAGNDLLKYHYQYASDKLRSLEEL